MNQYDETTKAKAEEYSKSIYENAGVDYRAGRPISIAFVAGRDSVKGSLEILARALEVYSFPSVTYKSDAADKAIAEVKARGDWPL